MTDAEILARFNVSDADLRDYLARYQAFFSGLNDAQKQLALRAVTQSDRASAAAGFGPDLTPGQLQSFLEERTPPGTDAAYAISYMNVRT